MTARFQKAYDVLTQAFFNGTLAKGDCCACAVGNLVASGLGGVVTVDKGTGEANCTKDNSFWRYFFYTNLGTKRQINRLNNKRANTTFFRNGRTLCINKGQVNKELQYITGYNGLELAQIEVAFEKNTKIGNDYYATRTEQEILEDQFNGLSAVFDTMMELDNLIPNPIYTNKLRTHPKLQLV